MRTYLNQSRKLHRKCLEESCGLCLPHLGFPLRVFFPCKLCLPPISSSSLPPHCFSCQNKYTPVCKSRLWYYSLRTSCDFRVSPYCFIYTFLYKTINNISKLLITLLVSFIPTPHIGKLCVWNLVCPCHGARVEAWDNLRCLPWLQHDMKQSLVIFHVHVLG